MLKEAHRFPSAELSAGVKSDGVVIRFLGPSDMIVGSSLPLRALVLQGKAQGTCDRSGVSRDSGSCG